ncbi:MAG: hypothetical protein LBQ31_03130 [Bacteroidales bacterium]|jgi:hypothetical protein|nr:hypothetical protein [Bacteroidales bacterium]
MKVKILTILAMATLLVSCYKKEDFNLGMLANEQDIQYDIALPLFETKFTVDNILYQLKSDRIITDNEGLVHFIFPSMSFVNFWEQVNFVRPAPISMVLSEVPYVHLDTVVSYTYSDTVDFTVQNMNKVDLFIDSIIFEKFNAVCNFQNGTGANTTVSLTFPSITDRSTGAPATLDITVKEHSSSGTQPINLTNVRWNSAGDRKPQNKYRVPVVATVSLDLSTATNESPQVGSMTANISVNDYSYNRIYGNVGQENHSVRAAVDASSLRNIPVDEITLYQLFLTSRLSLNGISIPIKLSRNRIAVVKIDGDTLDLPSLFPDNFIIPTPLPTDNPLQKTTEQQSEIMALIPIMEVKEFFGEFDIAANPTDLGYSQNVLDRDANVAFDFDMDVPMHFSMDNYDLSDTIPFNVLSPEIIKVIRELNLKMIVKNAFPIDADISVQFLDSVYNPIITVYAGKIAGGELGTDFHVVRPEVQNMSLDLLGEDAAKLKDVRHVSIISEFDTKDNGEVKIFAGSEKEGYISMKAGVRVKLQAGSLIKDYIK